MSETGSESDLTDVDASEVDDQISKEDSLADRDVDDLLDEGYTTPEHWSAAQGFGNTVAEMSQRETLDQRVPQEEPETEPRDPDVDWNPEGEPREVGDRRAGRLVDANGGLGGEDAEQELVGSDAGIDAGAASAEEAAVHVIEAGESEEPQEQDEGDEQADEQ